ncbi:cupin domain-containing protein [Flavobacterium tegetincola]|uniref:cupin domain-containing protein n=1 Tax=Flavobacterium tegetincola TaxID=150172 RepID=UPI000428DAA4|nr:cupin domain-containing protein [Flavobacterium tegetincola]
MITFGASKAFIIGDEMEWETVGDGVKRKIMGYDDTIMLVNVDFKKGSIGPIHQHYHAQVTYVVSGQFEVTVGKETKLLKAGDCFYIEPHIMHGAVCQEDGMLVDVFSPIREDFMQ